jgi:hypothetical protein
MDWCSLHGAADLNLISAERTVRGTVASGVRGTVASGVWGTVASGVRVEWRVGREGSGVRG